MKLQRGHEDHSKATANRSGDEALARVRAIDADSHVFEKTSEIVEYVDPPFKLPALGRTPLWPGLDGWNRVVTGIKMGLAHERIDINPDTWRRHLDLMDEVDIAVLLPTLGLTTGAIKYDDWAVVLCRAYNTWLADRYLTHDERFRGLALLPLQDPAEACKELKRCVTDLGMVGGLCAPTGMPNAMGHPFYWPIYAEAQRLDCPIVIHGGSHAGLGFDHLRSFAQGHALGHPITQLIQATSVLLEGVFDEFPSVRVGFFESGCAWLPMLIERLDIEFEERLSHDERTSRRPPSEHITGSRFFVTMENERCLAQVIEVVGDESTLYAVDFPHEADTIPARRELLEFKSREDIGEEAKQKILVENSFRFYGERLLRAAPAPNSPSTPDASQRESGFREPHTR